MPGARFLSTVAAAVLLTTMALPARAQSYDLCQASSVADAIVETHWDCGGARGPGKTFDYVVLSINAGDGHDYYIRRMDLPDSPVFFNSTSRYAWGTSVGDKPGFSGLYLKWTLVDDGSVRCWDPWRRAGYFIEIDPALCE